jgi:hypothetical protein
VRCRTNSRWSWGTSGPKRTIRRCEPGASSRTREGSATFRRDTLPPGCGGSDCLRRRAVVDRRISGAGHRDCGDAEDARDPLLARGR